MDNERHALQETPVKKEIKLSEESAREQMQSLLDSYQIVKEDLEIENGPEWIATVINRIVRAIRGGHVEILPNGEVKHNLVNPKGDITTVTYKRMNGTAMKERDKAKGGTFEKDCAFMGSLSNTMPSALAKFDAVDISIFQRIGQLFMVV